jgi:hypothetical protein
MAKVPCPVCHGTGLIPGPRDTIKMKPAEFQALLNEATRTPLPPPPPLPKVIIDDQPGAETMPDLGWFEKHIRLQTTQSRRRLVLLGVLLALFIVVLGSVQFCTKRYP